jgi:uncharacterized membrane protein HdeD (DUF308 family)
MRGALAFGYAVLKRVALRPPRLFHGVQEDENRMSQNLKSLSSQANPLNKQIAWWIVVAEGAVALLVGLFILLQPEQTNAILIQIVGGYLAVESGLSLYRAFAQKSAAAAVPIPAETPAAAPAAASVATPAAPSPTLGYVRDGVGLAAGLIALLNPWLAIFDTLSASRILAIGMVVVAVIGLYRFFTTANQAERAWSEIAIDFLYLIFAYMVLVHNNGTSSGALLWWVGLLTTLAGIGLVVYGIQLRRKGKAAMDAVAATPAATANSPQSGKPPAT